MLREYRREWLPKDVVAGLVLTTLLVPQGMAYAELAGLPAITGLYTSILCLVGYAIFGPSKILVLGPDSSLGPMIAATILPLIAANGDPARAVALASMLALIVGVIMVVGGMAKLGFVADLLSKPTMIGYMNGLAITILVGQLPKLFGFSTDANGLVDETRAFVDGVQDGETVGAALAVGVLALAVMAVLRQNAAARAERAGGRGRVDRRQRQHADGERRPAPSPSSTRRRMPASHRGGPSRRSRSRTVSGAVGPRRKAVHVADHGRLRQQIRDEPELGHASDDHDHAHDQGQHRGQRDALGRGRRWPRSARQESRRDRGTE